MLRVYSKTHPTGMWQASSWSWKSWEAKACKGLQRTAQEDSPTGRTFQKLLEPPGGSETANSEAVRKVMSTTLLNRN